MKDLWLKHRWLIVFFIVMALGQFMTTGKQALVFLFAGISLFVTLGFAHLFYPKRSVYLFSQIGLLAGFACGKVISIIMHMIFPINLEPYLLVIFSYLGFYLPFMAPSQSSTSPFSYVSENAHHESPFDFKLLDTSVIIDGRINDMVATGFITGMIIVPKFVLNEIQALADSQDSVKRSRARRGLDVLNLLHEQKNITLNIVTNDYPNIKGVDSKLVALAKEKNYALFTSDYNLNKVAKIEGVEVLNINDLVNAIKPVLLPGEELELDIVKEGKEHGQGLGYLPDGTMVVVANGAHLVGKRMKLQVTSLLQTPAGRIIFTEVV
ncbi:MAG: PIN/TRAM domain-containing protein [Brevinema sp.]